MSELNSLIERISCDIIDMKFMEYFKENLQSYKNRAEKIDIMEYKQIYINNISMGEEIIKLFSVAEKKYKEISADDIENYKQNELHCQKKESQNIEILKEKRELKKKIRKEHDYKKKQELQRALRQRELIISLNTKGNAISTDQYRATLLARYNIFKDTAELVNSSFNPFNSATKKDKLKSILELIEQFAGLTCLGSVLTIKSITKAVAEFLNSYDYNQKEENRIESINEEYQLQRKNKLIMEFRI